MRLLAERFTDARGFDCALEHPLLSLQHDQLPIYIPSVYHSYRRNRVLPFPWIAIPLYKLFRQQESMLKPVVGTAEELRMRFRVSKETKIVATGVGPDRFLESFWEWENKNELIKALAALNVQFVTAPNFTFFSNAPLPHAAYNRSRMLRIAERFAAAGIKIVLHLNSLNTNHWASWAELFRSHPQMTIFCKEFQTGYFSPAAAEAEYNALLRFQSRVGSPLHPILLGGSRFAGRLKVDFAGATIVDANPFMRTYFRRVFQIRADGRIFWLKRRTLPGEFLDARLFENVRQYDARLSDRFHGKPPSQEEFSFRLKSLKKSRRLARQEPQGAWELFANHNLQIPGSEILRSSHLERGPHSMTQFAVGGASQREKLQSSKGPLEAIHPN